MRVLVTGGAGFIGSHVVRHALGAGFEVAVLDDFSTGKQANVPPGVRVFNADLRDRDAVLGAVADFRPELVNHQAAQASVQVSKNHPRFDAEVNVIGGLNLLDACTTGSHSVRRFVFASTAAIYAEMPKSVQATESYPLEPKSPYGVSKLSFERLLTIYVGTGRATSTLELAESILHLTGSRGAIEHAEPRAGDIERSVFDASRFQQTLGAPTPLDVGLTQTAQWYREL